RDRDGGGNELTEVRQAGAAVEGGAGPGTFRQVSTEELAEAVCDRLPRILRSVCEVLSENTPEYGQFLDSEFEQVAEAGRGFVAELVARAHRSATPEELLPQGSAEHMLFEEIGRTQCRGGQDVSVLLSAYRTGARVAWTHIADTALSLNVEPQRLAVLATALFAAIDQISAASLGGYLRERQDAGRRLDRERQELAELLLSDRATHAAVRAAAGRVGWRLPKRVAVVLVDPRSETAGAAIDRLEDSCLRLHRPEALVAIVPDPVGPGRRRRLASTLQDAGAVVGPDVPPDRLPASLQLAHAAVRLLRTGVLQDDPLFVADHLDALIVHQNPRLLAHLRTQCLAPLDEVSDTTRARLCETLLSWLTNLGDRRAVAEELKVHPHTVTYRMGQLRELLGEQLDDPHGRAVLLLALGWGEPVLDDGTAGLRSMA
ncbi:MAG: PucR family transcriptional regulator, partial [Actinomycetes bacterium]